MTHSRVQIDGVLAFKAAGLTDRQTSDMTGDPGIIEECSRAITEFVGRPPTVRPHHNPENHCLNLHSSWVGWPCLLPRHGPGRKHARPITLTGWQNDLIRRDPGALLRGLIHSDGWRGTNKVISKGHEYEYPRYQFSNRSDDIRRIFTDACDPLGIEWRQWTRYHVSVAKRGSVGLLDAHVGPKR